MPAVQIRCQMRPKTADRGRCRSFRLEFAHTPVTADDNGRVLRHAAMRRIDPDI
jgi:hypothetical protein